LIQLFNR